MHQWIQFCLAACAWLFLPTLGVGVENLRLELENLVPDQSTEHEQPINWDAVSERIELLAVSTDLKAAQEVYLDFLNRVHGGLIWMHDQAISARFRDWLEDALMFAEEPAELAKVHYWLARHLHNADDQAGQVERVGRLYEFAVELDSLPEDLAWQAMFYRAAWARDYGIQSFDARGEVYYEGDYAFALELYRRLLDQYSAPDDEARETVEAEIASILRPELGWLRPNSFFPESEIQLRLKSRNLNQVHVELHPVSSLEVFEIGENGDISVRSDGQWRAEATHQSVFTPQPRRPHFLHERLLTLSPLSPGAYHLRARSGDLVSREWLMVTDFALIIQRDESRLQILAVQSESGQSLEGVELRIWLESDTGEWSDFGASIDQRGVTSFSIPEQYRSGRFRIAGKWQDRISLVYGPERAQPASSAASRPRWTVLPDLLKKQAAEPFGWRAMPIGMETGWLDQLDKENGIVAVWMSRDGTVQAETAVEISPRGVLSGQLAAADEWPHGLYRVAFRGRLSDSGVWQTEPVAAFYLDADRRTRIRSEILLDRRGHGLVSSVMAQEGMRGTVRLRTAEGAAVPAAGIRLILRNGPREDLKFRSDPIQTNAEGDAPFSIPESAFVESGGLVWVEVELTGETRETLSGKWFYVQNQPFLAELNLTERIYRIGDQIQVRLELRSDNAVPSSVPGTLIVHRERWQSVYVHRRRGNEITGEQYRELPERSLLGTSQGDFRLRDEGFVTEEVRRLDVRVEDGQALFALPVGDPGFYRMSWIAPGQSGRSVQADARFWVVGDAQRHMNYRPESLEIIFNSDVLSRTRSNRILVASPHLHTHALLSEGRGAGKQQQWLELPNRTRLFNLELGEGTGLATYLELNAVFQGQWLRDRRVMPVDRSDGGLHLSVERRSGFLRPGDKFVADVRALDAQGRAVDVELYTYIRPAEEVEVVDRMTRLGTSMIGADGPPWQTASSIESYPYPGSVLPEDSAEDRDLWCEHTEKRLVAEMQNMSARMLYAGRSLPVNILSGDDNPSGFGWPLPETGGNWVLEWIAVDSGGRVAKHREWVSTRDFLTTSLVFPPFARVGDDVKLSIRANNDSDEELSGDMDVRVWLNGELLIDQTRGFRLDPDSYLTESFRFQPENQGTVRIRLEMDRMEELVQVEREMEVLAAVELGSELHAKAISLAEAREVSGTAAGTSITADPWVFLGAAAQHAETLGSNSVDELAMRLLFAGRILRMEILPVDEQQELEGLVGGLIERIESAQNSDGGWSWVGRTGSDPWTSALVLFSLAESIPGNAEAWMPMMLSGRQYLSARLMQDPMNPRMLAWVLHATAHFQSRFGSGRPERLEARGFIQLMRDWEQLDPDIQSLLLLIAFRYRFEEEIRVLSQGLTDSIANIQDNAGWAPVESAGWRYPGLQRLIWFRGLLWSNLDMRQLTPFEPAIVSALFPGRYPVATSRFAQSVFAEYLMLKDHQGQLLDAAYSHPEMEAWSQEALDSVVADPFIYVLRRSEASVQDLVSDNWNFRRSGELRRLTPTLLRGLVEQVQPWTDTDAIVQGARLHLNWEWQLERPLERVRIDIPLPAGWIALPDSGQHLLKLLPDNPAAHRGYSTEDHQVTVFVPEISEGRFVLSLQLQAQTPGRYQIFSPKWTLHDSSKPLVFEEPVFVEILPSAF